MRDFRAFGEKSNSLHETQLLPPLPEGHPGLFLNDSFHCTFAGARRLAQMRECARAAGFGDEPLRHANSSGVGQVGKLKGHHLDRLELVQDHFNEVLLPPDSRFQGGEFASMQDEFPQERRDVHHATGWRQGSRQTRLEIESSHRNRP